MPPTPMQMQMHHMDAMPPGTFAGHVIPGSMLLLWGLIWLAGIWRARGERVAHAPLEGSLVTIALKIALPLAGVAIEWPGRGWSAVSTVMNLQHVSMYALFALSGVVDLLHRWGRVPRGATFVAFAGAAVNAGLLFVAHGQGGDASATAHGILSALFFTSALAALGEWLRPDLDLHWLRTGLMVTLGSWFYQVAWLVFRSGADLTDPVVGMRTTLLLSGHALGAAVVLLAVRLARPPLPAPSLVGEASPSAGVGAAPGTA